MWKFFSDISFFTYGPRFFFLHRVLELSSKSLERFEVFNFLSLERGADVCCSRLVTLAISKCYGKVRVLFFPRDNSLISRGNSHVSRVRGLVVRCLLFNPEVSCSNPWVCANFLQVFRGRRFWLFFRHYETFRLCETFFRLCETFFRNFLNVPKESSFQFFWYFARERMLKNPKGSLFSEFSALWDCSKF